jgi:hypothetical protein
VDHGRTSGELALADLLNLRVVAGVILVLLDGGLLGLLVGKFFNAGVREEERVEGRGRAKESGNWGLRFVRQRDLRAWW